MAILDTTRTTYGTASAVSRFFAFISSTATAVIAWNDARVTRKSLSALTDRELEDIGLTRNQIDDVVEKDFFR